MSGVTQVAEDRSTASERATPLVRFHRVNKHFGDLHVLRDISLDVAEGEIAAVIGPSGSGKSTLIRCVNALEPVDSGELTVLGHAVHNMPARQLPVLRGEIGMVFQSFNLYPHMTALENVTLAPRLARGLSRAEAEARGRQLLDRVFLAEKADTYPAQLSGGQQQRVAIARALAMKPRLLLFDEPTSALDPEMIGEVLDVIGRLAAERITMMIVTHEMNFARRIADCVIFMDKGEIVESGPPDRVMTSPTMPRTREFIDKIQH